MKQISKNLLKKILPLYHKDYEGPILEEERREKDQFFSAHFGKKEIENLDEGTLRQLIHLLWSVSGWTNKDWFLEQMLLSGVSKIRNSLKQLLYGGGDLVKRFDHVRNNVRMMGAVSISEILAHHDAHKYPIWHPSTREGLIRLGFDESQLPKSRQIKGSEYKSFCELAQEALAQVANEDPDISDYFKLYFLLRFVSLQEPSTQIPIVVKTEKGKIDFGHDATIDQLLELGDGLGFEVRKEFSLMHECRIDAIWRSRVANLGTITYAFEVHRRGSRDSAILNLQRVMRDPTVQKVVLVSSKDELAKFRKIVASLDERFRNSVGYLDVEDLQNALDHLQSLKEILKTLGLLNTEGFSA